MWDALIGHCQEALHALADVFGTMGAAIVVSTFALRAVLIPITLPATIRSQARTRIARSIRPQVKDVHRRFKDDPSGLTRELRAVHAAHGIGLVDGAGLISAFVQLPVLILLFQAVWRLAEGTDLATGGLLTGLFAAVVSALGTVLSGQAKETPWMLWLSAALPLAMGWWLGAGIALYLLGFYAAALVQALLMRRHAASAGHASGA